jgi:hypothetical protein
MEDYIYTFFFRPIVHLSSYIIGILTAVFVSHKITLGSESKVSVDNCMPLWLSVTGWSTSILCKLAIIWAVYPWNKGDSVPTVTVSALYACSCRTIWSLTHSWDIIAGAMGGGGFIVKLMSWRPFIPLARMTYSVYLVAPFIMMASAAANRAPYHFTHFLMFQHFLGFLSMSYGAAFIMTLVIEGPLVSLEKVLKDKWALKVPGKDCNTLSRMKTMTIGGGISCLDLSSSKGQDFHEMNHHINRIQRRNVSGMKNKRHPDEEEKNTSIDCFSFASLTVRRKTRKQDKDSSLVFGATTTTDLSASPLHSSSDPTLNIFHTHSTTPSPSASHQYHHNNKPRAKVSSIFPRLPSLPSSTDNPKDSKTTEKSHVDKDDMSQNLTMTTISSNCFNNSHSVGQMTRIE